METYTIKKGKHKSKGKRRYFLRYERALHWDIDKMINIIFDKNCEYDEDSFADEDKGINKAFGFTRIFHQEKALGKLSIISGWVNSWVLGWKCLYFDERGNRTTANKGTPYIVLYSYYDKSGKEYRKEIAKTRIPLGNLIKVHLHEDRNGASPIMFFEIEYTNARFKVIKTRAIMGVGTKYKFGYRLFPYFGGNAKAPHDMTIHIDGLYD